MQKTYIHEGTEVKLTGREAIKKVHTIPGKAPREMKLVEIAPVSPDYDWKKWVAIEQMYEVVDNGASDEG